MDAAESGNELGSLVEEFVRLLDSFGEFTVVRELWRRRSVIKIGQQVA